MAEANRQRELELLENAQVLVIQPGHVFVLRRLFRRLRRQRSFPVMAVSPHSPAALRRMKDQWEACHRGPRSSHRPVDPGLWEFGLPYLPYFVPRIARCRFCGQRVTPDSFGACPNCASHEFEPDEWALSPWSNFRTINEERALRGLPSLDHNKCDWDYLPQTSLDERLHMYLQREGA